MVAIHQSTQNHGGSLREDVLDIIFTITPDDTPFYNDIGDGKANDTRHYWTTRALTTRQVNAAREGESFSGNFRTLALPARVGNITQIFRKLPQVTRSMASSVNIGIPDLMADQISLNMVEFKTDHEHALLRGSVRTGTTHASDARYLGGLLNVVTTNSFDYGSIGTFTESMFVDLLQAVWNTGGNPKKVLVGASIKRKIGQFVASSTKFLKADMKEVTSVVNVYESDFGIANVRISRDMPSATGTYSAAAYDPDFFKKAWLDAPFVERLPKTGDSTEAAILSELTLEYGNEAAGGVLLNIQQSGI